MMRAASPCNETSRGGTSTLQARLLPTVRIGPDRGGISMSIRKFAFAAAALALCAPVAAMAEKPGKHDQHAQSGHGQKAKGHKGHKRQVHALRDIRSKACPPGLAKKNTGCLPPGQWRKGDRLPNSCWANMSAMASCPLRSAHATTTIRPTATSTATIAFTWSMRPAV